ncbi:hypothetical protein MPTK1_1g06940 [Marchantia polymorpha subsp. ruderalis]|uniref:Uncharacterized protein n=2 Tax=Marchantia polymorpha TaxID=3197 RepID=A0AAF6AMD4_MARPO|nr:hypothetical protein MARPO_0043s0085 [Marchantia polymorpha]BBM97604.1 hypothetical protein Mp_1g06940 [Marchantia polymorpha subsp. ruderalis]|eukprot:PTQ39844.1 hypothetical protein MARPO_0043s0085 [Marchantia polymorpha]
MLGAYGATADDQVGSVGTTGLYARGFLWLMALAAHWLTEEWLRGRRNRPHEGSVGSADGWMDGWMERRSEGNLDGWMDGSNHDRRLGVRLHIV